MDAQQLEALAQRLAANPADGEALQLAYGHGQTDPRGYAVFLEKAGALSPEPSNGAHWYCEAATVWTASLDDSHRAARALMHAVDKDPAGSAAADRLAALYAEKGDQKGVVALLERRIKLLERAVSARPELNALLGALLLQAGALWQEQFQQPEKALDAYQRATHHEPTNEVFERLRGLLVSLGRARDELPWIAEQARASADPIQRRDRFLEQAEAAAQLGDADVELVALRAAREADIQDDPTLRQRLGSAILSRIQAGSAVGERERHEARDLFVGLAEAYDGEYGLSYSQCALECVASDDRAAQLAIYYAEPLGRTAEIAPALARYLTANSAALLGDAARAVIFDVFARHGGDELLAALEPDESLAADERVEALTKLARALVSQKRPDDAVRHYERILGLRPAHEEAVDFVRSRLRKEKAHASLAELLRTAAAEESAELDQRVAWLEELAELSEGPLADAAGAIEARRRLVMLDPSDEDAALHLESALERAERWGDLAELLERRAAVTADVADRIVLELRLAELERDKRGDAGAAARALGRVARLEPDSQARGLDAVTALEKAGAGAAARELLADMLRERLPDDVRVAYSGRLGELLEAAGEHAAAGGAFAEVASRTHDAASWARAAEAFARAKAHEPAAHALAEQRALVGDDAERARLLSAEAEHLEALGDQDGVASRLREASELAPEDEGIAARLEAKYREGERFGEWVSALLTRARKLEKPATRAALRKRAAEISRDRLGDEEGMCAAYAEVLEDEEDLEALRALLAASEKDGDNEAALGWFARLEPVVADAERGPLWLRWATLLEDSGDQEEALAKLRLVLVRTPDDEGAIERAAALERDVGSPEQAVELFERLLARREGSARLAPARELARLEGEVLSRPERAFAAYQRVLELDAEDLETVERLRDLSERLERFEDLARYQKQLVEAEGDDDTAATLALQLAEVLVRLERSSEALTELEPFAELNPGRARDRYLELGDELGKQAHTARKLQEWLADLPAGVERQEALGVAYRRLVDAGVDDRALEVGLELLRQKGAPSELAESVERVALRARSSEGLLAAFGVLGRDTSGPARAAEMVRQAEQLAQVGVALDEVLLHGEQALTSALPIEVEPLLARLAALVSGAGARVDIYERQVGRCRSPEDRLSATVRAAEVASNEKLVDRARALLVLAVQTAGAAEGLDRLIAEVRKSDQRTNVTTQRALLAEVLALAGEAARDGGRSRAHYLSRAA
ncbi:MAG TPA: hypothetical protein VLC09_08065, partial [Polyangiaceae bacterium]|nr:hypothetical protein [Polyangiaceae bacterium]